MLEGWRCPTCHRVYAPSHTRCDHCGPHAAPPCVPPYRPYVQPDHPCWPYPRPYWSVLPPTVTVTSGNVCSSA